MRYRWAVLAAGTAAAAAGSALFIGPAVLAPAIREEFDASLSQVGVLLASLWVGTILTLLGWGLLADRLGERVVLGTGLGICAIFATAAGWALAGDDALTLALGSARDDASVGAVHLTLRDADGASARLPLARFVTVQPPFVAEPVKTPWLMRLFGVRYDLAWRAERVLQSADIPLAAFVEAEPALRLDALAGLRIEFDGDGAGELYVDEIGFHRGTGAR